MNFKFCSITLAVTAVMFLAAPVAAQQISDEARRHMIRGEAAMELAEDEADYLDAVREFKRATELAPGWADAWFNLAVAREEAGDIPRAIAGYRKYVELAPGASDAAEVEALIIKLEYKAEREQRRQEDARRETRERAYDSFRNGTWCWDRQAEIFGAACAQRLHNSGRAHVTTELSGGRFRIYIDWQNYATTTYEGAIDGFELSGYHSFGHAQYADANCRDFQTFTGRLAEDGRSITLVKRRVQSYRNCRITAWGNGQEELVLVRVK